MRYPKAIQHHSTSAQYPSYYGENTIQSLGAIQSHLQVFHMMKWHCGSNTTCNAQESFVWPFQFSVNSHSKLSVLHLCFSLFVLLYLYYSRRSNSVLFLCIKDKLGAASGHLSYKPQDRRVQLLCVYVHNSVDLQKTCHLKTPDTDMFFIKISRSYPKKVPPVPDSITLMRAIKCKPLLSQLKPSKYQWQRFQSLGMNNEQPLEARL